MNQQGNLAGRFARPNTYGLGTIVAAVLVFWLSIQVVLQSHATAIIDASAPTLESVLREAGRHLLRFEAMLSLALGCTICSALTVALAHVRNLPLLQRWALGAGMTAAAAGLFSLATQMAHAAIVGQPDIGGWSVFLCGFLCWLAPFGLWALVSTALFDREPLPAQDNLAARAALRDAQVRTLQHQLNPHFLYNTLNSISALILDGRNEVADRMVTRLSAYFRASLANDPLIDVPLADEIAIQTLYLDIERMRFGDGLLVDIAFPQELARARVPSLILQPLVEDALRGGTHDPHCPTVVSVTARRQHGKLVLAVTNSETRMANAETEIGLKAVGQRLAERFGMAARVESAIEADRGSRIELTLPLEFI